MKKATLEDLIKRKEQGKADKLQFKEVDVKVLGMSVTVVKQPLTRVLQLIDNYNGLEGLLNNFEMSKELIYMSVPLFQSEQLQQIYECAEPTDVVPAVLDNNLEAISELVTAITELYGLNNGVAITDLKN